MNDPKLKLTRNSQPTKMDTAPFGSECFVVAGDITEVYTQYSHDEEHPDWQLIQTKNS